MDQKQDPVKQMGTGEGESPLMKNATVRTMQSDVQSVSSSGGGAPKPYSIHTTPLQSTPSSTPNSLGQQPMTQNKPEAKPIPGVQPQTPSKPDDFFKPPVVNPSASSVNSPQTASGQAPSAPSSMDGMSQKAASTQPSFVPQAPKANPTMSMGQSIPPTGSKSSVPITPKRGHGILWVVALIVLATLLLVFYFIIYPTFFEKDGAQEQLQKENEVVVNEPSLDDVAPPEAEPTPTEEVKTPAPSYKSLFKVAADVVLPAELPTPGDGIRVQQAFGKNSATLTSTSPSFREIVLKDGGGVPVSLSVIMSALLPQVFTTQTLSQFSNASYFSYVDSNNTWPGYVAVLSSSASTASIQAAVQAELEKASVEALKGLYLHNPGAGDVWKQGKTGTINNRYLVFTDGSFQISLNYGWVGNTLVISTSYDGFKAALNRL